MLVVRVLVSLIAVGALIAIYGLVVFAIRAYERAEERRGQQS